MVGYISEFSLMNMHTKQGREGKTLVIKEDSLPNTSLSKKVAPGLSVHIAHSSVTQKLSFSQFRGSPRQWGPSGQQSKLSNHEGAAFM